MSLNPWKKKEPENLSPEEVRFNRGYDRLFGFGLPEYILTSLQSQRSFVIAHALKVKMPDFYPVVPLGDVNLPTQLSWLSGKRAPSLPHYRRWPKCRFGSLPNLPWFIFGVTVTNCLDHSVEDGANRLVGEGEELLTLPEVIAFLLEEKRIQDETPNEPHPIKLSLSIFHLVGNMDGNNWPVLTCDKGGVTMVSKQDSALISHGRVDNILLSTPHRKCFILK
ncbi:MAG: hypothetical protein AAB453_00355 [Patescibacteria group bacterium]